jgi:hypothetical protein
VVRTPQVKTRRKRLLIVFGVASVLLIGVAFLLGPAPQSRYRGYSVTSWLRLDKQNLKCPDPDSIWKAQKAFGTNAVPALQAALRRTDNGVGDYLRKLYSKLPKRVQEELPRPRMAWEDHQQAAMWLESLGPEAAPAIQELVQVALHDRIARAQALSALESIGPSASNSALNLEPLLLNDDIEVRAIARICIQKISGRPPTCAVLICPPGKDLHASASCKRRHRPAGAGRYGAVPIPRRRRKLLPLPARPGWWHGIAPDFLRSTPCADMQSSAPLFQFPCAQQLLG